ncbi:MAG: 30S ribosomal protein S16 [Planctomycetota bacterium]
MVRIRLQRLGRTHRPFYRINAIDQRTRRNGRVIENLGWFDPMSKGQQVELKIDRIKEWLGKGAQPSDTMMDILARAEVLDEKAMKVWEARRDIERKRGACKAALKTCEAAVEELGKLAEDADGDLTAFVNAAKRATNDAKRFVAPAIVERAEAAAEAATKAIEDAKAAEANAKKAEPAEEETSSDGEGDANEEASA